MLLPKWLKHITISYRSEWFQKISEMASDTGNSPSLENYNWQHVIGQ